MPESSSPAEVVRHRVRLSSDVTLAASQISMQNVPGLSWEVAALEEWDFYLRLRVASNDASDIKVQFTGPNLAEIVFYAQGPGAAVTSDGGTQRGVTREGFAQSTGAFGTTAVATQFLLIAGTVINGSTPGTVQFQAAQNTSDATAPVIKRHSLLVAELAS